MLLLNLRLFFVMECNSDFCNNLTRYDTKSDLFYIIIEPSQQTYPIIRTIIY